MEKKFIEVSDRVPVVCETDVLVIGGGVAGIAAALAARRNGARVTLLEKGIVLGGLATLGHVCVFLAIDDGAGNKIYGGLTEELLHLTFKYGPSDLPPEWKRGVWHVDNPSGRYRTTFNIPAAVIAFDEIMEQEGVDVVFDTVFSEPIMGGDVCRGVIAENKSGRTAYMAKMIIDASGDADVFARAGAECVEGGSPVTHWTYEATFEKMKEGIEAGDILKAFTLRWFGLGPGNPKAELVKGIDSEGVNTYIRHSRAPVLEFLKTNERRKDYAMMTMPFMPQFRMTRMIRGLKQFELRDGEFCETSVGCMTPGLGTGKLPVYEFPYEALLDERIANIAAAGRIVASADGDGWAQTRYIPACTLTGEAAGTAAALAIKEGCILRDLPIAKLQKALEEAGNKIHV